MKLGFWNRLAIAVTVLAVVVAPLAFMVVNFNELKDTAGSAYQLCTSLADEGSGDAAAAAEKCDNQMFADLRMAQHESYSWPLWLLLVGITLALCGIVYGLIWGTSATARWIWRGRKTDA